MTYFRLKPTTLCLAAWLVLTLLCLPCISVQAEDSRFFPETGKMVDGKFLEYWNANGGLPVFGYPISEAQMERNSEDGKTYLTQWFERHRFEFHPEFAGTKFEVLTGLLGKNLKSEALVVDADFQRATQLYNVAQPKELQWYFEETGHNLRFRFLEYWQQNGGLERFGYPISEEHEDVDPETGNRYIMQWFERARFEYHPENKRPYDVLLGLLGKQIKFPTPNSAQLVWKQGGERLNALKSPTGVVVNNQGQIFVGDRTRIFKYDQSGLFLGRWGSGGREEGQFYAIADLTIDSNGLLYVADDNNVQVFDDNGKFIRKLALEDQATVLGGIALDQEGNIYVTDTKKNQVIKLDSNGKQLLSFGSSGKRNGQFSNPQGLVVDSQGNIYVVENGNSRIQKFDSTGQYLAKWDATGNGNGQFSYPNHIALDSSGNFYVSETLNNRVQKFDPNFNFLLKWGSAGLGDGQFNFPSGLGLDKQGFVYVASDQRIQKFNNNGQFLSKIGETYKIGGAALALDVQANVFVLTNTGVQKFDRSGHLLLSFESQAGTYDSPQGITVDQQGNIYVADTRNHRVLRYDPAGHLILTMTFPDLFYGQGIRYPLQVAVDSQGNLFVAQSYQVWKLDRDQKLIKQWGRTAVTDNDIDNLFGMALDPQGNVYISDFGKKRVQKYDNNGNLLTQWVLTLPQDGSIIEPYGLAVDSQGFVYVSTTNNGLYKFDQQGKNLGIYKLYFREFGIDSNNNLYGLYPDSLYKYRLF